MSTLKLKYYLVGVVDFFHSVIRFLLGIPKKYDIPDNWNSLKVTILIPAYNEAESIENTIRSIFNQSLYRNQCGPKVEILVVDDCSTDNTAEIAESLGVKMIKTPTNTGTKAKAQNHAIFSLMDKDPNHIIVTIDADTTLGEGALEKIILPLQNPKVVSACCMVVPQRRNTFWELARYVCYIYEVTVAKHGQCFVGTPLVSSGCCSAYMVNTLIDTGGFPPETMVEDMDHTWTCLSSIPRSKVALVEDAVCYPIEPPTFKVYKAQMFRWLRGFFQVLSKQKTSIFKRPSLAIFILWNLIEGILAPLAGVFIFYQLIQGGFNAGFAYTVLLVSLSGYAVVIGSALIYGLRHGEMGKILLGLPCYFLVGPVNIYIFWVALIKQWILKDNLTVWEKGH